MSLQVQNKITLDFTDSRIQTVRCVQGDINSRVINITLTNRGTKYIPENGVSAKYKVCKPDNVGVYNTASINSDGTISVVLSEQATAVAGIAKAELQLVSNTSILSTMYFNILIVESVLNNKEIESRFESDVIEGMREHTQNKDNPHKVTKEQLGLGNVQNVSTNNQTPTYAEASSLNKLVSGEKLSVAFGKIAKAIKDLASHISDKVIHITSSERSNWNDAYNKRHSHDNKSVIDAITSANISNWNDKYTKTEIDNKFSTMSSDLDWKESVSTFTDIAKTYPSPQDGWTVNVKDTNYTYRYDGTKWVAISANAIPKATSKVDGLMSKEDKEILSNLSGSSVSGVKGDAESSYRSGNVNLTPANLGVGFISKSNINKDNPLNIDDLLGWSASQQGSYWVQNTAENGLKGTHPFGIAFYRLYVMDGVQIGIKYGSPQIRYRMYTNNKWSDWWGSNDTNRTAWSSETATVAAKTVTCADFAYSHGSTIIVAFAQNNAAANPTLNVNGTGALPIYYKFSAFKDIKSNIWYKMRLDTTNKRYDILGELASPITDELLTWKSSVEANAPQVVQARGIPSNLNIDTLNTNDKAGIYWLRGDAANITGTLPFANCYGILIVFPAVSGALQHVFYPYNSGMVYQRVYTNNKWYAWRGNNATVQATWCGTAAATAEKAVSLPGFTYESGAELSVGFNESNTASTLTINVNGLGAKPVKYKGVAFTKVKQNTYYRLRYSAVNTGFFDVIGELVSPAISMSTAVTTTGEYAMDAVQNNASVSGTVRNEIESLKSRYWNSDTTVSGGGTNNSANILLVDGSTPIQSKDVATNGYYRVDLVYGGAAKAFSSYMCRIASDVSKSYAEPLYKTSGDRTPLLLISPNVGALKVYVTNTGTSKIYYSVTRIAIKE